MSDTAFTHLPKQDQGQEVEQLPGTYGKFVSSPEDLIGLIAYSLYKRDKMYFCVQEERTTGQPAIEQEIKTFIKASTLPTKIESYRAQAEVVLEVFSEVLLDDATTKLQREYQDKLTKELKASRPFSRGVLENLAANILALALSALLIVIATMSRSDPVVALLRLIGYEVTEQKSSAPQSDSAQTDTRQPAVADSKRTVGDQ